MAEPNWYYSHGDEQLGPVTAQQLKKMAADGGLIGTDLVWKEGMDDWVPATQIDGLIPLAAPPTGELPSEPPPSPPASPPSAPSRRRPTKPRRPLRVDLGALDIIKYGRPLAQPLILIGLLLVLLSHGCDSVSRRSAPALKAEYERDVARFERKWKNELEQLQADREAAVEADDSARVSELGDQIRELPKKLSEARKKLQQGVWRDAQADIQDAQYSHDAWGWWRGAFFVLGTIGLSLGLLVAGFTGEGEEKWICLIILAVIIYSIYGGGSIVDAIAPRVGP